MTEFITFFDGWTRDEPTDEHVTRKHESVAKLLSKTGVVDATPPSSIDLRPWCSPVQFQGRYNTCQSHVVIGLLEFLENVAGGRFVPASRLFLYQATRRLAQSAGDAGEYIRTAMGALEMLGVPPEKYYPYLDPAGDDPRLTEEPDAFSYALARDYRALESYRLDSKRRPHREVLDDIRCHAASKLPTTLGFPLYEAAVTQSATSGQIPFATRDTIRGTHAVLVVGYDDALEIENQAEGDRYTGAFLIRNSWSDRWGLEGYGWLSYDYLLRGHARDVWCMLHPAWVDTGKFGLDPGPVEIEPTPPPTPRATPSPSPTRTPR